MLYITHHNSLYRLTTTEDSFLALGAKEVDYSLLEYILSKDEYEFFKENLIITDYNEKVKVPHTNHHIDGSNKPIVVHQDIKCEWLNANYIEPVVPASIQAKGSKEITRFEKYVNNLIYENASKITDADIITLCAKFEITEQEATTYIKRLNTGPVDITAILKNTPIDSRFFKLIFNIYFQDIIKLKDKSPEITLLFYLFKHLKTDTVFNETVFPKELENRHSLKSLIFLIYSFKDLIHYLKTKNDDRKSLAEVTYSSIFKFNFKGCNQCHRTLLDRMFNGVLWDGRPSLKSVFDYEEDDDEIEF